MYVCVCVCVDICIVSYWAVCSPTARETGFNPWSIHTKASKMVLDASLLNTQYYELGIKDKMEQSRKRSSASV